MNIYRARNHRSAWSPSRTQQLTLEWLSQSGLQGDDLLLEALLRRGFLAYSDDDSLWLGTGSHPADIAVLQLIDGLGVQPFTDHPARMACIRYLPREPVADMARQIVFLPHHQGMSRYGLGSGMERAWDYYQPMAWGAKCAVCPATELDNGPVSEALDTGTALLVKTLPLARVATALSCDGHGDKPAYVNLYFPWDAPWGQAVFQTLGMQTPHSQWNWYGEEGLEIVPIGGYGDSEVLGMLHDIQQCSRRLMNQTVIDRIGFARRRTLGACTGWGASSIETFRERARKQLALAFA